MIQRFAVIAFFISSIFGFNSYALAQNTVVTAKGDDLHYLGYVLLTGDTLSWVNIESNDIYNLSRGLYFRKTAMLDFVKDVNLYFFGNALITGNKEELQKIKDDNWFYLGSAIFEKTTAYLENVTSDDVYYLGKAVVQRDFNFLNRLSSEKK
jgi:hypothetical protein